MKGFRTVSITVKNIGSKSLNDCSVREGEFTNKFGISSQMQRYFRLREDMFADMSTHAYAKTFDLRVGESQTVDIAYLDETNDESPVIMLYATEPTAPTLNAISRECFPHRLTISVTADNLPVAEKRAYELKIGDDGILIMTTAER